MKVIYDSRRDMTVVATGLASLELQNLPETPVGLRLTQLTELSKGELVL